MLKSILAACAAAVVFQMAGPANAVTEHAIYAFKNGSDGALPISQLIAMGGILYGTTEAGGTNGAGVQAFMPPKAVACHCRYVVGPVWASAVNSSDS